MLCYLAKTVCLAVFAVEKVKKLFPDTVALSVQPRSKARVVGLRVGTEFPLSWNFKYVYRIVTQAI